MLEAAGEVQGRVRETGRGRKKEWVIERAEELLRMEAVWAVEVVSCCSDGDKWNLPSESGMKLYLCRRKDVTLKNYLLKVKVGHN
ncbi:unnamed protein product [Tetraodon nigroviridis]|uniref:(spotted green pufferfish) hypothetical protein n=1 Tax=Tetraodon nigroviridis TaxID=99883 RepID=Q4SIN1_TETNG|nr:unnamed protein product [Tetraodon nigroviridis]